MATAAATISQNRQSVGLADLKAHKARQQVAWSSGDYALVGTTLQIVGEELCEGLDVRSGQKVLSPGGRADGSGRPRHSSGGRSPAPYRTVAMARLATGGLIDRSAAMGVATACLEPEPVQALFLPDGAGVQVRPAAPRDESVIQAYIGGLSSKSRFDRFHGALNELPAAELHRMTHQVDARQQTLIAETLSDDDTAARMIGEARYAVMPDGRSCEFAVSVAEAWRRRTLGMQLLRNLAWRAKRFGVRYLVGDVLRTNAAMTALARKTGFRITAPIADDRLLRITKDLSLPDAGPACEASTAQSRSIAV